jgi:branched-chain amino acid transport system substrate-binding protein
MKRKLFAVISLVVLVAVVFTGCTSSTGGKQPETIKIGHAVALTGGSSMWGQAEKNALEMEVEKINKAGGVLGKQIQLIAYDTKADQTEAVNITKRLIGDKVVAIIGPGQSGVSIAMTSVTEPAGVPFLATTASNPKVTVDEKTGQVRKTAFRMCFIDPFQGAVAAQFALKELNSKKAAVLFDIGSDYSQGLRQFFVEAYTKGGGTIVAEEAFRSEELDYRAILGKIKDKEPDVLFIPTMQKEAAMAMKQARDLGMNVKFLGGDGWASPDLISLGGSATEGAYFVNIASLADPQIQQWIKEYRDRYKVDPVMPNPVMAVDALFALVEAMKRANSTDSAKIIAELEKFKDVPVLTGKLTIDPKTHNPVNKPAVIEKIQNGQFVFHSRFVTTD